MRRESDYQLTPSIFIAIPSTHMPHSSLFLPFLHPPTPLSSFLSSTHTKFPDSFLFLLLLQPNKLLLLPTPLSADSCPRALHASDSPLLSLPSFPPYSHSALFLHHTLYTTNTRQ